jgi:DNA-binding transcriptional regulator YiaG
MSRGRLYATAMHDDDAAAAEQAIARALDLVGELYDQAAAAVAAVADPAEAFRQATDFANRARTIHDEQETKLRKLRAAQAVRIRDKESLSLARLADRISVSKTRADQLVRDAAKGEEGS